MGTGLFEYPQPTIMFGQLVLIILKEPTGGSSYLLSSFVAFTVDFHGSSFSRAGPQDPQNATDSSCGDGRNMQGGRSKLQLHQLPQSATCHRHTSPKLGKPTEEMAERIQPS